MNVTCDSQSIGSGVQGLRVEVQTQAGAAVPNGSATETAAAAVQLRLDLAAGSYVLRVSKSGQDPEVTGNWYDCVVR